MAEKFKKEYIKIMEDMKSDFLKLEGLTDLLCERLSKDEAIPSKVFEVMELLDQRANLLSDTAETIKKFIDRDLPLKELKEAIAEMLQDLSNNLNIFYSATIFFYHSFSDKKANKSKYFEHYINTLKLIENTADMIKENLKVIVEDLNLKIEKNN